jgi:dihydroflavonol-4-reductase
MIAITGATGHIGNVLIRELLAKGNRIRAVVPPGEDINPIQGLDIEIVQGDVRNPESLIRAFSGIETVYHLAGIISILPGKKKLLEEVNVKGTQNVVEACLKTGVRRLIHTSSIHALKEPPQGTIITEEQPFDPASISGGYGKTKARASLAVLKGVKRGLNAVIVCPTGVIGPYDYKISEMGQLVRSFLKRRLKVGINGAYDFVDVRDVAKGMILAGEKGRAGESYILSGQQISVPDLLSILGKISGIKAPGHLVPCWLARIAGILATPYYLLNKTKPLFTAYSIDVLASNSLISSSKARRELGYSPRSITESLTDTVNWLKNEFNKQAGIDNLSQNPSGA